MSISFSDSYYDFNEILRFNWCMLVNHDYKLKKGVSGLLKLYPV